MELKKGALRELGLSKTDELNFKNGPLKPEGHSFEPWSWKDPTVNSLRDIAAAVSGRQGGIVKKWENLAWYNFGYTDPPAVNCCLRDLCGCDTPTGDRWNYQFIGGELIWVPTEEHVPPTKPLPAIRKKPTTLAEVICPKVNEPNCTFDQNAGHDLPNCRKWPDTPNGTVTLGGGPAIRIVETTQVRMVALHLTIRRIARHDQLAGRKFDWINQTLMWENVEESHTSEELDKTISGTSAPTVSVRSELTSNLVNPKQLQNLASVVAKLQTAGMLKRLILRGYADQWEAQRDDPVELSKRRAQFIADRLHDQYSLSFGKDVLLVIGCGAFYAPVDPYPDYRVATAEIEMASGPPATPGVPKDIYVQKIISWTYNEFYEEARNAWFSTLVKDTETSVGRRVRDTAGMQVLRKEALQYVWLFKQVCSDKLGLPLDRNLDNQSFKSIEQHVLGWNVLGAGSGQVLPKLDDSLGLWERLRKGDGRSAVSYETTGEQYICATAGMSQDRSTRSRVGETLQLGGLKVHFLECCPPP